MIKVRLVHGQKGPSEMMNMQMIMMLLVTTMVMSKIMPMGLMLKMATVMVMVKMMTMMAMPKMIRIVCVCGVGYGGVEP